MTRNMIANAERLEEMRSHMQNERLQAEQNAEVKRNNIAQLTELTRTHKANEKIGRGQVKVAKKQLKETKRTNKANERIKKTSNKLKAKEIRVQDKAANAKTIKATADMMNAGTNQKKLQIDFYDKKSSRMNAKTNQKLAKIRNKEVAIKEFESITNRLSKLAETKHWSKQDKNQAKKIRNEYNVALKKYGLDKLIRKGELKVKQGELKSIEDYRGAKTANDMVRNLIEIIPF